MKTDIEFAEHLALGAGNLALEIRLKSNQGKLDYSDFSNLGAYADRKIQNWIEQQFIENNIQDTVLSEEAFDSKERLKKEKVWIIDPLDGSGAFSRGSREYAIHIGLWEKNKQLQGVLNIPENKKIFSTNDKIKSSVATSSLVQKIVKSKSRDIEIPGILANALNFELFTASSAGFKASLIFENKADIYIHQGEMNEWDTCAPVAVALNQGFKCTDFAGNDLIFNKDESLTKELLICKPSIHQKVIEIINY